MLASLRTKIFADGAELESMRALAREPYIKGFTTNPTLMRKAGVSDYRGFAKQVLAAIPDRPISFEVFSDEFEEMERQALEIATWGEHVYVKIPVTNTNRVPAYDLINRLSHSGRTASSGATGRAHLGEPARAAEYRPGRCYRLPHHHGHAGHPQKAPADRQGPGGLLARHGQDVPRRRAGGRVLAGAGSPTVMRDVDGQMRGGTVLCREGRAV